MPEQRERDRLAAWENEGGAVGPSPRPARATRPAASVLRAPGWLGKFREVLRRRLRNVRPSRPIVRLALRTRLPPILCGDCGVSEQNWSGTCARCGGGAWIAFSAALPARGDPSIRR